MPRKATYPEWVTRHLTTGIYVNKVGGCYYLYRAHSEHQPGVSHPVRVCDEYLGRVTEADGLIRSKGSVRDVVIFDFGIPYIIYQKTSRILDGLSKSYENGQTVYVCAILDYLFSFHTQDLYKESWLSMVFPKLNIPAPEDSSFTTAVERGQRMISILVHVITLIKKPGSTPPFSQ